MRKVSRGTSFRGVIAYAFADKHSKFLGASKCVMATTQRELVREFGAAHVLRPGCKKPVWHQALRLPPGEVVSHEKQLEIAHEYMLRMGFDPEIHQYAVIAHGDDHVHIIASRVGLNGTLWLGKNENLISTRVVAGLEKAFGLQITKGPAYVETLTPSGEIKHHIKPSASSEDRLKRASRKEEMRHARLYLAGQAPEQSPRQYIVSVLNEARRVGREEGLSGFLRVAESRGVEVRTRMPEPALGRRLSRRELVGAAIATSEAIAAALAGIVFRARGLEISGSRLGGGMSAPQLSRELAIGDGARDAALIAERTQPYGDGRAITPIPKPIQPPRKERYGYQPIYQPAGTPIMGVRPASAARPNRFIGGVDSVNGVRSMPGGTLVRVRSRDADRRAGAVVPLPRNECHDLVADGAPSPRRLRRGAFATDSTGAGEPEMTHSFTPNPSLGGSILTPTRIAPEPEAESPPPPPPPPARPRPRIPQMPARSASQVTVAAPSPSRDAEVGRETRYRAEVERLLRAAKAVGYDENAAQVLAALDKAEDAFYPGRRERREMQQAEIATRIEAIVSYARNGADAKRGGDTAYKAAAADWLAKRAPGVRPTAAEWREFDRTRGLPALVAGHIPPKVADALTRLSPAAVRSLEAFELGGQQVGPVIADYGKDEYERHQKQKAADLNQHARASRKMRR